MILTVRHSHTLDLPADSPQTGSQNHRGTFRPEHSHGLAWPSQSPSLNPFENQRQCLTMGFFFSTKCSQWIFREKLSTIWVCWCAKLVETNPRKSRSCNVGERWFYLETVNTNEHHTFQVFCCFTVKKIIIKKIVKTISDFPSTSYHKKISILHNEICNMTKRGEASGEWMTDCLLQRSDLQSTQCDTFRHHWVNSTRPFCFSLYMYNTSSTNSAWTIKSSAASVCLYSCWKPCRCPVSYHKIDIARIHPPTALHSVRRPECVKSSQRNRETDSLCLTDSKGRDRSLFEMVEAESH